MKPKKRTVLTILVVTLAVICFSSHAYAVDPSYTAPSNQSSNEGESVTFDLGTFTDDGTDDTHTATVEWGDGVGPVAIGATKPDVDDTAHTYTDEGVYTVTVTVSDGDGGSDTGTFTVTVSNVAPTAVADAGSTNEDGPAVFIDLTANDTDPGITDDLEIQSIDVTGTQGSVAIDADNDRVQYDPNGAFESLAIGVQTTDTFDYTVEDGDGGTDTATVTVTITGQNDGPDAVDDTGSTFQNTPLVVAGAGGGGVLSNDTDVDATDVLNVTTWGTPSTYGATVVMFPPPTFTNNGGYTYDPTGSAVLQALAVGETVVDTFTYTISDGNGGSDTATVSITVTGVNEDPVANDDNGGVTDEDSSFTTNNVLTNDTDTDISDTLSVASVDATSAAGALITDNANGTFGYDPNGKFETMAAGDPDLTDTFTYTVSDGNGGTDTATVTVTITGVNDAPVANDDSGGTITEDTKLTVAAPGVLGGAGADTDVDASDTLSVSAYDSTSVNGASVVVNVDGSYEYDPTANTTIQALDAGDPDLIDTFTYTVSDGKGGTDTATVTVTVTGLDMTAAFIAAPTSGNEPLTVDFTETTSSDDGVSWSWDLDGDGTFGDETTRHVQGYVYTQDGPGTYDVKLRVTDGDGDTSETLATTITVSDTGPTAVFDTDIIDGAEPLTVEFYDQSTSYDGITSWDWDYGDGSAHGTTADTSHEYVQDGTYTVTLTVTETDGPSVSDSTTKAITVSDSSPTAEFSASPTMGPVPLTVEFTENSSGYDGIASWAWDFGDTVGTSTDQHPIYIYTAIGEYTATLTVTDGDGSAAVAVAKIKVTSAVGDPDDDGDGWTVGEGDCDDTDSSINPEATETCGNNIDEDCYDGDLSCPAPGECITLADKPLDVQLQASAPNIMIVLDDSGSMDWDIMTDQDEGLYWIGNDPYYYINATSDNLWHNAKWPTLGYSSGSSLRRLWKVRWGEYNKVYYNPTSDYIPWAGESDAHLDNPRSHPMDDTVTVDLSTTYYQATVGAVGGGGGGGGSQPVIVDDFDGTPDFDLSNDWNTNNNASTAYNGKHRYTSSNNKNATWQYTIPETGDYEISAHHTNYYRFWQGSDGWDQNAKYEIYEGNTKLATVYKPQGNNSDGWESLGTYNFTSGETAKVKVYRTNSSTGLWTGADAVKFILGGGGGSTGTAKITIAHYYTWDDTDSDGALDSNEDVYLVNFADADGNGIIDGREFYLFSDNDSDDTVDDGELVPVDLADVPAGLKGRTYAEDHQNFANWFSFYRRRWLTTVAALSQAIPEIQGVMMGYRTINGNSVQAVVPLKVTGKTDKTQFLIDRLKNFRLVSSPASTPLRDGLNKVGLYFHMTETTGSLENELKVSPISTDAGGGCQQNFALVFTDGSWNGGSAGGGHADQDQGEPYADDYPNTLADVAMYYYKNDLAPAVADTVPINFFDKASWQHMVTYGITFGVVGVLNPDDYDLYNIDAGQRVYPTWLSPLGNDSQAVKARIDDVWHAAVNGRGQYLSAENPQQLVQYLLDIISDIAARIGSGSAVTINGEELDTGTVVFQSLYNTDGWTGDVKAYPVDIATGEVKRGVDDVKWSAEKQLRSIDPGNRLIATFDGTNGIPFRYSSLTAELKDLLDSNATKADKMVDYLRGDPSQEARNNGTYAFRDRLILIEDGVTQVGSKLGDIVHSAPTFNRYTHAGSQHSIVYAGGNDGMLHAFDADTGIERFAYIPRLIFDNLKELTRLSYDHKFYVDLSPFVKTFGYSVTTVGDGADNDSDGVTDEVGEPEKRTILVGGLGKGGKGYYALDVTDPMSVGNETQLAQKVLWEYPASYINITNATNASPIVVTTSAAHGLLDGVYVNIAGVQGNTAANGWWKVTFISDTSFSLHTSGGSDSTGNGAYTSGGTISSDPDMGYSYSRAFAVDSALTASAGGWVVIFGNGYNSPNGNAVLYVLDAITGTLLKKIDTQTGTYGAGAGPVGGCNGLSVPQIVDVNNDGKVDYAYAGDLNGNLWKFDLTASTVANWDVAYKDGATPKPLFQALDALGNPQPITAMPDVMRHCNPLDPGYLVTIGTGRYLGATDFSNISTQTIYGIWDYGDDADNSEYLGSFDRNSTPELTNQAAAVTLQKQGVFATLQIGGNTLRIFTGEEVDYNTAADATTGQHVDAAGEAGWYVDLPERKERVVRDLIIRSGKVIVISSLPNSSACSAGGESFLQEMDACTGGRLEDPVFDINEDQIVDEKDLIKIENPEWAAATEAERAAGGIDQYIYVAPTSIWYSTMIFTPSILDAGDEEIKLMSTAAGGIVDLVERGERKGIYFWKQIGF